MTILTRFAVLFYVTLVLFSSCFLLLFVLHKIDLNQSMAALSVIYFDETLRQIVGAVAAALLLINFVFYRLFSVNTHRDKIIAFDNPAGRVTVSLAALEDLVKRTIVRLSEIKDVRMNITASKKGLKIKSRLILRSEVNIPEITSKVQDVIRKKIQDMIGIDEPLNVTIYVGKIIPEAIKGKRPPKEEQLEEPSSPPVPFQGYRA